MSTNAPLGFGLTPEDIAEFMRLYEAEFGEPITEDEARMMASRLLFLYLELGKPLPFRPGTKPDNS
jgi:hypothetical protein